MTEPYEIFGMPQERGILVVVDHASNHVPPDIDLGIDPALLEDHIAYDIGVANIARYMAESPGYLSILGTVSRLVVDLNRYPDEDGVVPKHSDGVEIPGNIIDQSEKAARLDRFFHPYHDRVAALIRDLDPVLTLFLHSFTPKLRTDHADVRPWQVGVLYNEYDVASRLAIQLLEQEELVVGDQQPYSGKDLHATMKRQAEDIGKPYTEIEIRQDMVSEETGQRRFAEILLRTCDKMRTGLA
ncbi:N-formylglutamate amidohydrolase [Parasphingorhabdus cellanae]|uniref:N-formylglutamate amidohydrolase n=1 Tax=Parasphingorhabdus cellanae TaxID=2806553 RepID=A0ABX7T8N2_9SPHN|nr:N-formylglutamate amidohydrolase [Parasphingorhabdus cellanae]QTD56308.1 N-formylglutamate amidohydrolase [Parasphingorhabdus cellanae]